jgi:hypothetical protein
MAKRRILVASQAPAPFREKPIKSGVAAPKINRKLCLWQRHGNVCADLELGFVLVGGPEFYRKRECDIL